MWLVGGSATHARKMFSMQQRCVKSAFTTGVPGGTRGALIRYESSDMIGWKSDLVRVGVRVRVRARVRARARARVRVRSG